MPTSLIIVDDFLSAEDARGLREAGLKLSYPPQRGAFPGRNSFERLEVSGLTDEVSRLVGERLKPMPPTESHAKFRISLGSDEWRAKVHVDASHWSGILYLSRPEDCQGGTEFFRHIPTNTERAPYDDAELAAMGYQSRRDMFAKVIDQDGIDESKWEMTMRVPMRFNRLVLLRPWLWHSAGPAFGDSLENGRFVYLMFYAPA